MALIPLRIERTSRPPAGTPLRRDGHWSVRDLYSAFALNEAAGPPVNLVDGSIGTLSGATWNPHGLRNGTISQYAVAARPMLNPPGDNWSIFTIINKDDNSSTPFPLSPSIGDANLTSAMYMRSGIWFAWATVSYNQIRWTSAAALAQAGRNSWAIIRGGSGQNHTLYKNGISLGAPSYYPADLSQTWTNFKCLGSRMTGAGLTMEAALFYHRSLLPAEVEALTANPWQIFEPEIVWVSTSATVYTETLTDLITSQASVLDRQDYLETADVLIQSGVSVTDVQTMLEAVLALASTATSATDSQTYSDTINETLISATSVTDTLVQPDSVSEALLVTATAVAQVTDAQNYVNAVIATALATGSLSELRLLLDNISILCQSQVSVTEIQSYLQSIITTASASGSVTDILIGAFVGRYLALEYAAERSFDEQAVPRSFAEWAAARSFTEYASPRGRV